MKWAALLLAALWLLLAGVAARSLGLDVLGQLGAVLGLVFDRRDHRLVAEAPGVDQVALLGSEELQAEVADRGIGKAWLSQLVVSGRSPLELGPPGAGRSPRRGVAIDCPQTDGLPVKGRLGALASGSNTPLPLKRLQRKMQKLSVDSTQPAGFPREPLTKRSLS
jgi:hypothetical protein